MAGAGLVMPLNIVSLSFLNWTLGGMMRMGDKLYMLSAEANGK